jgi:hypothetical protein
VTTYQNMSGRSSEWADNTPTRAIAQVLDAYPDRELILRNPDSGRVTARWRVRPRDPEQTEKLLRILDDHVLDPVAASATIDRIYELFGG